MNTNINCPNCNAPITIDPVALINGTRFQCTKCQVILSISSESIPIASKALDKFYELKNTIK